ncbi:MAG: hypothetical protein U0599_01120 [Vicinamibacteria bacterium]
MPFSTSYHVPHSSTTRPTFRLAPGNGPGFCAASAFSIAALCFAISSSIRSVWRRVENHMSSPKSVAEPFFPQLPVGSVGSAAEDSPFIRRPTCSMRTSVQRTSSALAPAAMR